MPKNTSSVPSYPLDRVRRHKLLTLADARALPHLGDLDGHGLDSVVRIKFFSPTSGWTWYITEGEERDGEWLFYGLVLGFEAELGYVSLHELATTQGPYGITVERDQWFKPKTIGELLDDRGESIPQHFRYQLRRMLEQPERVS